MSESKLINENLEIELGDNASNTKKPHYINAIELIEDKVNPFMTQDGWKAFNPELAMEINPTLKIGKLKVGDYLIRDNSYEVIGTFDYQENNLPVYNFELDGSKDYYADGYLVHNK